MNGRRNIFTASLRTHSFVFFPVHETRWIFLSSFISKASRHVSSFFLRVQLSQPYVTTGHTSTFISRIFVEIGMLWLFHIFCSDAAIACPLFNLIRNSVVHSPSSVIRDPRYGITGTYPSALVVHSEWVFNSECPQVIMPKDKESIPSRPFPRSPGILDIYHSQIPTIYAGVRPPTGGMSHNTANCTDGRCIKPVNQSWDGSVWQQWQARLLSVCISCLEVQRA